MTSETFTSAEDKDELVAKIGQTNISFEDILNCLILKRNWQTIEDCLDHILTEITFDEKSIQASTDEISQYMTNFRQEYELHSADDTIKWLDKNHLDDDDFYQLCEFEVKLEKLKAKLFDDQLEAAFAYKKTALKTIDLYKIVVANEDAAREIVSTISEGASFFDYARKYSIDGTTAKSCGYMGKVKVSELPAHVQDLLIKAESGDLVGPIKVNKNFEIYLVESIENPELDDDTRKQLADELYAEWLADTKARASIELFI